MSHTAPFRQRPNLHLALTQSSTGSPRHPGQTTPRRSPNSTPISTPGGTPFATTSFSPLRSAGPRLHTPYSSSLSLPPRRPPKSKRHGRSQWLWAKRILASRPVLLLALFAAIMIWLLNGGTRELKVVKMSASDLGRDFLLKRRMQDYQFFPATNPKIHFMGRWTATPNRLRKDGTFPGVYFDVVVKNTTSFFISLHNAPRNESSSSVTSDVLTAPPPIANPGHLSFHPLPTNERPAAPISLLFRVNLEEYVLLPNATSLVPVCANNLSPDREYKIRVVAPMVDDGGKGVVELEGLWLSKGGSFEKVSGSLLDEQYLDEDALQAENRIVGERHQESLAEIQDGDINRFTHIHRQHESEEDILQAIKERRKVVEIITDSPGSFTRNNAISGAEKLLAGVMGWEYLLGDMFDVDHVCIGVDGMCLTQDCHGSNGYPAGLGDAFFRNGPYGSHYFDHSWEFSSYTPDLLILNVGESDLSSFVHHGTKYNASLWDLSEVFENTYVSLVKGIRRLGYSKHPTILQSERLGLPGIIPHNVPASIPIFIMRPLRGQLEHSTQNVVANLRADGDRSVFWLDTSGWLDTADMTEDITSNDLFSDNTSDPPRVRLTEQGNRKVAIFLHAHVCRYLAKEEEKCAFLPQEVYQGTSYDQDEADFDDYLETQKERKLKDIFWVSEVNPASSNRERSGDLR